MPKNYLPDVLVAEQFEMQTVYSARPVDDQTGVACHPLSLTSFLSSFPTVMLESPLSLG